MEVAAFYFSAFSHVLRAAVQGLGRPDLKAKLDLANVALFLALLFVLTPWLGFAGAAAAKLTMMIADLAGLLLLASYAAPRALRGGRVLGFLRQSLAISATFVVAATVATAWLRESPLAYGSFAGLTAMHAFAFWKWIADERDRRAIAHLWEWVGDSRRDRVLSSADVKERE